jgi:formylglycine-generating enzyme required for sulfatase activity
MQTRLQELGFYADIARQPAILERLVAYLAGAEIPPVAVTDREAPAAGMIRLPPGSGHLPNGQVVEVPAFTVDRTPTTITQYAAFITAGGYTTKRYWEREGWAVVVQRRKRTHPTDWQAQQRQPPEHPVVGVTWFEADAYCRWAGKVLPAEVQWERACQEVPEWHGPVRHWEWTAEAVWKGGGEPAALPQGRCATRLQSYPALEGQHTGFRCLARTPAAPPAGETAGQ